MIRVRLAQVILMWSGLSACGSDSGTVPSADAADDLVVVATRDELVDCENEGQFAYVRDEQKLFACVDNQWMDLELVGAQGPAGVPGEPDPMGAQVLMASPELKGGTA